MGATAGITAACICLSKNKPRPFAGARRLTVLAARMPSRVAPPPEGMPDGAPPSSRAASALSGWANTRRPSCPPRLTERRVDGCRPVLRYANRVAADVSTTTACRAVPLAAASRRVALVPAVHYPAARKPLCSGLHIWISSLSFRSPFCTPCAESRTTSRTAGAAYQAQRRY